MNAFPEETLMDLLLWRHAEAEQGSPDAKRKLTARGEKQAAQMGEWLRKNAPKKLRIVASPALRCQQTARALGVPFETDARLGVGNDVSSLLAAIGWPDGGDAPDGYSAVLVVSHQPTLGQTPRCCLAARKPGGRSRMARYGGSPTAPARARRKRCCARRFRWSSPEYGAQACVAPPSRPNLSNLLNK